MRNIKTRLPLLIILLLTLGLATGMFLSPYSAYTDQTATPTTTTTLSPADSADQFFAKLRDIQPEVNLGPDYCSIDNTWDAQVDGNGQKVKIHFLKTGDDAYQGVSDSLKGLTSSYMLGKKTALEARLVSFYSRHYESDSAAEQALASNVSSVISDFGPLLARQAQPLIRNANQLTISDAIDYYKGGLTWYKRVRSMASLLNHGYDYDITKDWDFNLGLNEAHHPALTVNGRVKANGLWGLAASYDPCPSTGIGHGGINGTGDHSATLKVTAPGVSLINGSTTTASFQLSLTRAGTQGALQAYTRF